MNKPFPQGQTIQKMKLLKVLSFFLLFLPFVVSAQLVWPGDVNNNGVVNEADLLALGFVFGETGPIRPNASTDWEGQAVVNWIGTFPNGVNKAFADCNGDGIINGLDVAVIEANFGLTHADVVFIPDEVLTGIPSISPAFEVLSDDLEITPNQRLKEIEIGLGNLDIPVDSITGLSFYISMNPEAFDVAATEFQLGGWLQGQNIEVIRRVVPGTSPTTDNFLVAYTKTDKVPISGEGIIGNLLLAPSFVTEADFPDLRVNIDSVVLIDENQEKMPAIGVAFELSLPDSLLPSLTELNQTICPGESYLFNGLERNVAGIYRDTQVNQFGKDSIIILNLLSADTSQTFEIQTICAGSSLLFNGQSLTMSGIYRDTFTNSNGCDSFVVLFLNVTENIETAFETTICPGESFTFGNRSLSQPGVYRDTFIARGGCDSLVTLELFMADFKTTILEESICEGESRTFKGEARATSGSYMDTLKTTLNCDSLVQLNLTVLERFELTIDTLICGNADFVFEGFVLPEASTYWFSFEAANGCDSLVTVNLDFASEDITVIDSTICPGESVIFEGFILSRPGTFSSSFTNNNGCDSTIILNLTVDSCQTTSTFDADLESIQIFPNPTQQFLHIQAPDTPISSIEIINVAGQMVFQKHWVQGNRNYLEIDLKDISNGVYWVRVLTEKGVKQELVVRK